MSWATQGSADINSAIRTEVFGGPQRSSVPRCRVFNNADFTQNGVKVWAQGGWIASIDPDNMFLPFVAGSFAQIIIPITGQWDVELLVVALTPNAPALNNFMNCGIGLNDATGNAQIAADQGLFSSTNSPDGDLFLKAHSQQSLTSGTRLFWYTSTPAAAGLVTVKASIHGSVRTAITARFLGPT